MEPGGDDLDECVSLWKRSGMSELIDVAAHHEEHLKDWFGEQATSQKTWMKLIWLILAYKGIAWTSEATLAYEKTHLGRATDETALLELSALPARNNDAPVEREIYREERALLIRERMLQHKPTFVVFYAVDPHYQAFWSLIAGHPLVREEPIDVDGTTCVMTCHPNGKWDHGYWEQTGLKLRAFNDAQQ